MLSKRAKYRMRGREKAAKRVVPPALFHMFAPNYPAFKKQEIWHMVHPLKLNGAACVTKIALNGTRIQRRLPTGVRYCENCRSREHFVEVFKPGSARYKAPRPGHQ